MAFARIFLAFDPPTHIIADLRALQRRLRRAIDGVAWVPPTQFHTTLVFLGGVDELLLPALLREVASAARVASPFGVSYEGLGAFPGPERPEVLWVGCANPDGRLAALKGSLDEAVMRAGVALTPGAFHPHVTLGRFRRSRRHGDLIPMLELLTFEPRRTTIGAIHVMKSTLSPQGAQHSILATNPLQPSEPSTTHDRAKK